MTVSTEPAATLSDLPCADGSATFSQNGYTIIGAVNGPIEVQRRDELPEEAAVDVIVRPAAGVGGTRERHLETILQSTLRQIILIHTFPRTLIQVTLQIFSTPENDRASSKLNDPSANLPILPALLQTAILALLSATMPMADTLNVTLLALKSAPGSAITISENPTPFELQEATSIHVLAFASSKDLLVAESEGEFTIDDWNKVYEKAEVICCGNRDAADKDAMLDVAEEEADGGLAQFVRSTLQEKAISDLHWKG